MRREKGEIHRAATPRRDVLKSETRDPAERWLVVVVGGVIWDLKLKVFLAGEVVDAKTERVYA